MSCPSPDRGSGLFPYGVSVFFPAFNDAPSLPQLLQRTFDVLRRCVGEYEVIVVDDGSADDTGAVLEQLQRQYAPYLRVITHPQNLGYGAALRTGFANASNEFIFYTDGDGQYDPSELARLLAAVTENTGLVNGYKICRNDPWHRVAIGWLYNQFARTIFGIQLRDIDCDFRLIRRSALGSSPFLSTSGTICVELVSRLERSGAEVIELPVSHYPRLHGRSQFFRIKSLATTFLQLCALFFRLMLQSPARPASALSLRTAALVFTAVTLLSLLAYWRSFWIPFISDDYVQIALARRYGPVSGWPALMQDALYRCRATSLVLTHWTELVFGIDPVLFSLTSLAVHILNAMLVFALGVWRPIGWKVSAIAACVFAVSQRHHEAVMWYAALPELLVFFFCVLTFLLWIIWLQSGSRPRMIYAASILSFVLAMLSKESAVAVVPLMFFAAWLKRSRWREYARIVPFTVGSIAYFGMAFAARKTHLHFNDGTFSLSAPFVLVLIHSSLRLFWVWGTVALVALAIWRPARWIRLLMVAGVWCIVTLLPYSFLTYMTQVPSRHTYFASVGLALTIAAAIIELHQRGPRFRRVIPILLAGMVAHQCAYLWFHKQSQFELRAQPTETLIHMLQEGNAPAYLKCFPYDTSVATLAANIRIPETFHGEVEYKPTVADHEGAVDLCTEPDHKKLVSNQTR